MPATISRPRLAGWLLLSVLLLAVACSGPPGPARPEAGSRAGDVTAPRIGAVSIFQIGAASSMVPREISRLPRWVHGDVTTVLLLGVDRRATETARSDSIVLATIDLRDRRINGVSIPRDLLVEIPGVGIDRVNAAFAYGEHEQPRAGPLRAKQAIERNFQVSIGHWLAADFECFRGTVNAIGGIEVEVPRRVVDLAYPTDDWGYQAIVFEPGRQWMDGERALQYARTRHADSDFGRMRRQQQVLMALRSQLLTLQNLAALPLALQACQGLNSDLAPLELVALAFAARGISEDRIHLRVIDETMARPTQTAAGASVLAPRWEAIRPLIRELLGPPALARP